MEIKNLDRAGQVIEFSGLRYGKSIRPTDIDGCMEYHGEAFAFFEMKYGGASLPEGQRHLFEHIVDSLTKAHKKAAVFVCRHDVKDTKQVIIAEKTIVTNCLCNNGWKLDGVKTLGECLESWLRFTCPKALED